MAVTVRAFDPSLSDAVAEFTSHFPQTHGGPLGRNNWQELGIPERDVTWRGQRFPVPEGSDLLYWGCGATPRFVAEQAKLPFLISYSPGSAMITDVPWEALYAP